MKIKQNVSQEALSSQLIEIAPRVNGQMRTVIAATIGYSIWTVNRYLDGEVKKVVVGKAILEEAKRIAA